MSCGISLGACPRWVLVLVCLGPAWISPGCGTAATGDKTARAPGYAGPIDPAAATVVARQARIPQAPPGERLVLLKAGSVWMMNPGDGSSEQLTVRAFEAADRSPSLSPDGRWLLYSSSKDGVAKIYRQSLEDLIPEELTSGEGGGDDQPAWSPDGKHIAFMRGDARLGRDLYIMSLGDKPRRILAGNDDAPERVGSPVWSRDSLSLYLSADRREHRGTAIWRVDIESGSVLRVTPAVGQAWWTADLEPSLSPDGQRIAFASNRHTTSADHADDFDVYTVLLDGSGLTRLTEDPGTVRDPCYSSDGKRLFFASTRIRTADFEWEVYVMPAGGGEQQRVTRDPRPQNSAPSAGVMPAPAQ